MEGTARIIQYPIQQRTKACQNLFEKLLDTYAGDEWLENRQADFNLWSAGIKAAVTGKSSLDHRVRDHPDTSSTICDYLDGIEELLQCYLRPGDRSGASDDESADDDDVLSELRVAFKSIMHGLVQISNSIRSSGTKFRFKAADLTFQANKSSLEDLERLLTIVIFREQGGSGIDKDSKKQDGFKSLTATAVCELAWPPTWTSEVQARLVRANLIRRNRILYATRTMRESSSGPTSGKSQDKEPEKLKEVENQQMTPQTQTPQKLVPNTPAPKATQILPKAPSVSMTKTATEIGSQYDEKSALKGRTPSVMTQGTRTGLLQEYPRCPKPTANGIIQCPYCADTLTEACTKNEAHWRGHVAQDLLPYSCVFPKCSSADEMYRTRAGLEEHMRQEHSIKRWTCPDCNSLPKTQALLFDGEEEWKMHMVDEHDGAFQVEQLPVLSKLAIRVKIGPFTCPLCRPMSTKRSDNVQPSHDVEHLAECLHRFALLALPPSNVKLSSSGSRSTSGAAIIGEEPTDDLEDMDQQTEDSESTLYEAQGFTDWIALGGPVPDEKYEGLGTLLRKYARDHCDSATRHFWPLKLLRVILTRKRVLKALGSLECGEFDKMKSKSYCKLIVPNKESLAMGGESLTQRPQSYMKVFAILLLSGRGKDIEIFVEHQMCDERLPLVNISSIIYSRHRDLSDEEAEIEKFFKAAHMESHHIDSFYNYQRGITVHFFDLDEGNKVKDYNLSPDTMLPWLRSDQGYFKDNTDREGGYSLVKRYRIDPSSHGFDKLLESVLLHSESVAVKVLKESKDPKTQIDWRKEVNMLCRFNGLQHSSLITLLATFTQNNVHHLVFPCAQCDLEEYWTETPGALVEPGRVNLESMRWVSKQIRGLMEALTIIHNPLQKDLDQSGLFGRHGDLKPENILWFESPADIRGILVITDLGTCEVHSEGSRSDIPNKYIPRTPGYRPPECDIEQGKISRAFDIWTMGCLFLEKACWLLGGNVLRREFEEERYKPYLLTGAVTSIFFDIQQCGESGKLVLMVKESVTERLQNSHNHPGCTDYVHELLDLIQKEMIVVLSGSKVRARADVLLEKLDIMHGKAMDENQIDYITKNRPRDNPKIDVVAVEAIFNYTARERVDKMIHLGHKVTTFNGGVEKLTTLDFERVQ